MANTNSRMKYLNVSLSGLRGRNHPALANIVTTVQVQKSRIHLKMLAGDYFTYEMKSKHSGGSPHCRCCPSTPTSPLPPPETLLHIITVCGAYSDIRKRITEQYRSICSKTKSNLIFDKIYNDSESFCQFVLDPASFNLSQRININDPALSAIFGLSRDFCFGINAARMKILKNKASEVDVVGV